MDALIGVTSPSDQRKSVRNERIHAVKTTVEVNGTTTRATETTVVAETTTVAIKTTVAAETTEAIETTVAAETITVATKRPWQPRQ